MTGPSSPWLVVTAESAVRRSSSPAVSTTTTRRAMPARIRRRFGPRGDSQRGNVIPRPYVSGMGALGHGPAQRVRREGAHPLVEPDLGPEPEPVQGAGRRRRDVPDVTEAELTGDHGFGDAVVEAG